MGFGGLVTQTKTFGDTQSQKGLFFCWVFFPCGSSECGEKKVRAAITGGEQCGDSLSMKPDDNAKRDTAGGVVIRLFKKRFDDLKN